MKLITFATTNDRKLNEARAACKDFGIEVIQIELDIDEIQHHDPKKIAEAKASEAFRQIGKPVVVTDTSWSIPVLCGFPGGYMKEVADWFEPKDFLHLMTGKANRSINFIETIAYQDEQQQHIFSQEFSGKFASGPRGKGNSIEQLAEFDGYTIAERHDQGRNSHNPKDYVWYKFAEWFANVQ